MNLLLYTLQTKRSKFETPPHDEMDGDVFDRQRVVVGWDQELLEEQVCFVMGTGGLGQSVAFALARMGVKRIHLLDMDTIDASNLNRQMLAGKSDVDQRKVDVARKNLVVHTLRSEIVTHHCNAVTSWGDVVNIAKDCTVLFNCIDYGAMFDHIANTLSKALCIPMVCGSSYANTMLVEYYR